MSDMAPVSYIRDSSGKMLEIADEYAREQIEVIGSDNHPVGSFYLTSSEEDNPAANYGGTWELLDASHLFIGANVYKRIA